MKKLATINVYQITDSLAEDDYQNTMMVEMILDVETPFGIQVVRTQHNTSYANNGKSPAGRYRIFVSTLKVSIDECLKRMKKNLLTTG